MGKKASGNAPQYGGNQAAAGQQPASASPSYPPSGGTAPNKTGGGKKSAGAPNQYQPQMVAETNGHGQGGQQTGITPWNQLPNAPFQRQQIPQGMRDAWGQGNQPEQMMYQNDAKRANQPDMKGGNQQQTAESAYEQRISTLMQGEKNRAPMSREEAEANQRSTIEQGGDYNNDGAVTNDEWARWKTPAAAQQPVQQPAQQPVQQPAQEPVAQEPVQEPVAQPAEQPVQEPAQQPVQEAAQQPAVPQRPATTSAYTPPPSADSHWVPNDPFWTSKGGSWQQGASSDPKMAAQVQGQFDKANPQAPQAQGQAQQQGWQNQAMDWLRNGGQQEVMAWLRQQGGGYSNNDYGAPRNPYQGDPYAQLPGNDSAILGEGETQGNPFINNRNFEQNDYSYNDGKYRTPYGTTLQNPANYANMGNLR